MYILLHLLVILYPCMGSYWALSDNNFPSAQQSIRRTGARAFELHAPRAGYGLGYIKSKMGKGEPK